MECGTDLLQTGSKLLSVEMIWDVGKEIVVGWLLFVVQ